MNDNNKLVCNICGAPKEVAYKETDHETGKTHWAKHTVDCMGHYGVHARLWNKCGANSTGGVRSLGYTDYKHYYDLLAKERPNVPRQDQEGIEDTRKRKEEKRKERRARKNSAKRYGSKGVFPVRKGKTGGVRGKSSERRGR